MKMNRRQFCEIGLSGLLLPRIGLARPAAPGDRKFLFVYLWGGADQTTVLAPTMDHPNIPDEAGATIGSVGDLLFVDHFDRPNVRRFFEAYGDQSSILHGMEVRSIAHERCQQLIMTGSADAAVDDWPAILAGHASSDLLLPCLVHSGPSFSASYTNMVVRLGQTGQLSQLLDGSALTDRFDGSISLPTANTSALVDQYLREQAALVHPNTGRPSSVLDGYSQALDRLADVKSLAGEIDLSTDTSKELFSKIQSAIDCLEDGLSRTVMVEYRGVNDEGFDTHSANARQSDHQEELFGYLLEIMDDLSARTGASGGTLLEETVVVVFSEMGRHPLLNDTMGKDHWTFTSAMFTGGGITGGRVFGGYDEDFQGLAIDPSSGDVHPSGIALQASHFGATILALGDVDPGPLLPGITPITALIGS
jgi:uncharacterized protein (DUF1501 family)